MECRCKEQQTKPCQPPFEAVAPAQVLTSQVSGTTFVTMATTSTIRRKGEATMVCELPLRKSFQPISLERHPTSQQRVKCGHVTPRKSS